MWTRLGNRLQLHDGLGQLRLQRTAVIHLLHERSHAQRGLIEEFESLAALARHPFHREIQAELLDLLGRHEDAGAAVLRWKETPWVCSLAVIAPASSTDRPEYSVR